MPAPDDAMDAERRPAADWPHWPDRGNGRPRRDRLERRLFRDSERDAGHAVVARNGDSHLVFAWTPGGYALHEVDGDVPAVGGRMTVNGDEFLVAKLAASPLPGDTRRCAYLEPRS